MSTMKNSKTIATMKNIFKSLMFVAVAAMTFTACEKENADNTNNNGTEQKTVITFNADFADTRSQFTGREGDVYKSAWTEGDVARFVVVSPTGTGEFVPVDNQTAAIDKNNCFTVTFHTDIQNGDDIAAFSPAASWNVTTSQYGVSATYTIPTSQTPLASSVDPKAHILKAEAEYSGDQIISLEFAHQVAYAAMTLNLGEVVALENIVRVEVLIDETTYKLANNGLTAPTFWFACEESQPTAMSVKIVDKNDKVYAKTLTLPEKNPLKFDTGKVTVFSVGGFAAVEEEANLDVTYLLNAPEWMPSAGAAVRNFFEFDFADDANEKLQLTLHADVRPNNKAILTGRYTGAGDSTPGYYQFAAQRYNNGRVAGYYKKDFNETSTLDVSFADGVYTIILTHPNGETFGYKGMPDGWDVPTAQKGQLKAPVVTATAEGNMVYVSWTTVDGAENYTVSVNGEVKKTAENTETTYTFEGEYSTTYTITVVANPTDSEGYNASTGTAAPVTTGADPNAGGGDDGGGESVAEWEFSVSYQGMMFNRYTYFIFTGTDGTKITTTLVYPSKSQIPGTYEVSSILEVDYTNYKISEIIIGNTYATSASGTIDIAMNSDGTYTFTLDLVINGTNYKGSAIFG